MYIIKGNKFKLSISLHSFKGIADKKMLIDSRAMENFIDHLTTK